MTTFVLQAAGYVIGNWIAPGTGGYWGALIGSLAGSALQKPQKITGPKLDDLSAPKLQYGQAIPRLYGRHRVSGVPIYASALVPHESTEGGKGGGPEVTTTTYTTDILYLCTIDTPVIDIARVWVNKKLVYSVGPETDASTRAASERYPGWSAIELMDGNAAQTAWAPYEAAVGIGTAPAYRHRTTVGITGLNLGQSGQIPLIEFELFTAGVAHQPGYSDQFSDGLLSFTGDTIGALFSGVSTIYGGGIQVLAFPPSADPTGTITKVIPTTTAYGFRVKFYIVDQLDDDAGIMGLGGGTFAVNPRRETAHDPNHKPFVYVDGVEILLHSAALDYFTWYEVQVDLIPGVGNSVARLYNVDTGALVSTNNWPSSDFTSFDIDDVLFVNEHADGTGDTVYADLLLIGTAAEIEPVDLSDIVSAECARVGLDASKIEATDLVGVDVTGYATTVSARGTLEELAGIFYFEAFCDDRLRFVLRGGSSAETIAYIDSGAGANEPSDPFNGLDRADELTVPSFFSIVHADLSRDYELNSVMSDRLVGQSTDVRQVQTNVVLSGAEAKGRADTLAYEARVSSHTGQITLDAGHLERTPSDVMTVTDIDGTTYRSRIMRLTFSDWILRADIVLDDPNTLQSAGIAPPDGEPSIVVTPVGPTLLTLIDGPILRDVDDESGMYGATRINGGIGSSRIFKSVDGVTFDPVVDVNEQSIGGIATTALADVANPYVWDEVSIVTVNSSGALSSSTRSAMQADRSINLIALRSGEGWEYLRFRTASLLSAGVYTLSGFIRGLRGTETFIDGHAIGDTFVLLRLAGMRRLPVTVSEIGLDRYWKAVTIGSDPATAPSQVFANNAVGLKPFSPVRLRADRNSAGDITLSGNRRTRLAVRYGGSGGTLVPLGEDPTAGYQWDIYDGADVVRVLSSTTESVVYTIAQQTTDFGGAVDAGDLDAEMFQLSATVGRGYGRRANV